MPFQMDLGFDQHDYQKFTNQCNNQYIHELNQLTSDVLHSSD